MKKWLCLICGWIYDEAKGWPTDGIAAGTKWEDIPEDWLCPDCLVSKADFEMIEISNESANSPVQAVQAVQAEVATLAVEEPVVIVGSGHAAYQLVLALRAQAPDLAITVFTADDGGLYSKPALSNALALGKDGESLLRESALSWEQRLNIRVYAHTQVEKIDRDNKKLITSIGEYPYARLVLAVGATPIVIPVQGAAESILRVNDLADYRHFRSQLQDKKHVTILGDGLIACEFANDLATQGIQVCIIGLGQWPMQRLLPEPIGNALQQALSQLEIEWKLENSLSSMQVEHEQFLLQLADGQQLRTDLVLSAVGLSANTQLAKNAGLAVGRGIQTNLEHRTSDPAIFALGDCAEVNGQWAPYINPINQAIPALVQTLLGRATAAQLSATPVVVKTPIMPLSVLPASGQGSWVIEQHGAEHTAAFLDEQGRLQGFVLLGAELQSQRNAWLDKLNHNMTAA